MHESRDRYIWTGGIAAIAIAGMVMLTFATRWGIGTSSDSARYLKMERMMAEREMTPLRPDARREATHFPPFFPAVIAVAASLGGDDLQIARWIQAALFALNIILAGNLVRKFTGSAAAGAIAAALVTFSPAVLAVHATFLSEPLFIFLVLVSVWLLARYLSGQSRWQPLIGSALAAGGAALARYAGAFLAPMGAAAIVLLQREPWPVRRRNAIIYLLIGALPPTASALRNRLTVGAATNREIAWHPISLDHLSNAADTIQRWIMPGQLLHFRSPAAQAAVGAIVGLIMCGVIVAAALNTRRRHSPLEAILLIFLGAYLAMLVVSISFFDFHTPLDERLLSPAFVAWALLLGCLLARGKRSWASWGMWGLAGWIVLLGAFRCTQLTARWFREGKDYTHRLWRENPLVAATRALPPQVIVYSNATDVVYLLCNRYEIAPIPSRSSANSLLSNPDFEQQMDEMGAAVQSGRAVIVYFERQALKRQYYATDEEMKKRFGLHRRFRNLREGTIFDFIPVGATRPTVDTTRPTTAP